MTPLTESELQIIQLNSYHMSAADLAYVLNRPVDVVRTVYDDKRDDDTDNGKAAQRVVGKVGCNAGKRDDLDGLYVRSAWEANYARYLNWLVERGAIASWQYEPDTFEFHQIKKGTRFYTPDFKVFDHDGGYQYHEVKGWMDSKSKTKLKRMAKYYPGEPVIIIGAAEYGEIKRTVSKMIDNWE